MARVDRWWVAIVVAAMAAALAPACGPASSPVTARPYGWVRNGGVGPRVAACDEIALRIDESAVRAVSAPAPGCGAEEAALASDVGAAYAFAQTGTAAAPAGPIVSNPVQLGLLGLASGADQRGLASGADQRGLASGADQRGLASGADQRGLASGADQRGLSAGANHRELSSGAAEHGLSSGAGQRGLSSGADQRALDAGASERGLASGAVERPQWSLRKSVSAETIAAGGRVEFRLTFVNDGPAAVERLVVVDRVDAALRVEAAPGARAYVLEDGSTLLVWDTRAALPARHQRTVMFTATLEGQSR
jgi:uncharacterized repeat protein (TIGR01451 family)